MRTTLRLYGGAVLAGLLGMAIMLSAVRFYRDYQDFQVIRAFVFPIMQQQIQQQRQAVQPPKESSPAPVKPGVK